MQMNLLKVLRVICCTWILHIIQDSIAMHIIYLKMLQDGKNLKFMGLQERWIGLRLKVTTV